MTAASSARAVPHFFQPGDHVVWRSRPHGQVGYVIPATVVVDNPTVTVLYQAAGTICKRRAGQRGGPQGRNLLAWDGSHEDRRWDGPSNLRMHCWGTSYAIIRNWNTTHGVVEGWYINLERPWQRTPIGFDTLDLVLDITVADDGASWAWKDEDELAWGVRSGTTSAEEATTIRAAGLEAIAALEARQWPFAGDWAAWQPDSSWPIPTLPDGWDNPNV